MHMNSSDPTESTRRKMVAEINSNPGERAALETKHGQVWDTNQLQAEFEVHSFFAPIILVTRKSDGMKGTLEFQHSPRFYYKFVSES
jgi:hypothetical protein